MTDLLRRALGHVLLRLFDTAGASDFRVLDSDGTAVLTVASDGDQTITGDVGLTGDITQTGDITLTGTLAVTGAITASLDVYPDGEGTRGLAARFINRLGVSAYSDHFRSGTIPTGFSWISDGDFNGTPSGLAYNVQGTYMQVVANDTPHFLADAISTYADKVLAGRMCTGLTTDIALRADDGSNDNYAEIFLDAAGDGTYNVSFRYRAGGGGVTTQAGPTYPCTELVTVELLHVSGTPAFAGYTVNEAGSAVNITGFNTGGIAWTPSRVGVAVYNNGGNYAFVDWLYSTFA